MRVWWITLASSYLLCLIARSTGEIVYQQGRYTEKCNKVFSFMAMAVLILVAGAAAFAVVKMYSDRKQGKNSCGCNCKNCPSAGMCHKAKSTMKK